MKSISEIVQSVKRKSGTTIEVWLDLSKGGGDKARWVVSLCNGKRVSNIARFRRNKMTKALERGRKEALKRGIMLNISGGPQNI